MNSEDVDIYRHVRSITGRHRHGDRVKSSSATVGRASSLAQSHVAIVTERLFRKAFA